MSDEALSRSTDPETSREAAYVVNVNKTESLVLRALYDKGSRTWDEVTEITGLRSSSVSPRFKPLRRKGLIVESGDTRKGESGRMQTVWKITEDGEAHVRSLLEAGKIPPYPADSQEPERVRPTRAPKAVIVKAGEVGQLIGEGTTVVAAPAVGISPEMVDAITAAQWKEILDGQTNMKGWVRKRFKRAIRLLTEGRIYDDPDEDGRTLAGRQT